LGDDAVDGAQRDPACRVPRQELFVANVVLANLR
jgi:hypothetical protein